MEVHSLLERFIKVFQNVKWTSKLNFNFIWNMETIKVNSSQVWNKAELSAPFDCIKCVFQWLEF